MVYLEIITESSMSKSFSHFSGFYLLSAFNQILTYFGWSKILFYEFTFHSLHIK